jgi:transposase-like protein
MYESITYAELKSLPKEQKIEALKELKELYSSQKKIAEKLGVNPPNIYNMISRYIKEDSGAKTGKKGAERSRTAGRRQERQDAVGSRRRRNDDGSRQERHDAADNRQERYDAADSIQERQDAAGNEQFSEKVTGDDQIRTEIPGNDKIAAEGTKGVEYYSRNDFLISIAKELTGEEAQSIFAGIGNIFLKNREYRIDIKITEK